MMSEIYPFLMIAFLLSNYIFFLSGIIRGLNKLSGSFGSSLPEEFISVIIPFRNESENILISVQSLTSQNYPPEKFEVIYVNDSSTDDSYQKLVTSVKPNNFRILSVENAEHGRAFKKRAVNYGIENSRGDIIVSTDADCIHQSNWLRKMVSDFDPKTAFISGPVSFASNEKIFSKIQTLEFAGLVLSGAGLIGLGKATICNGANLAFRKKIFNELNGYSDQLYLSSGEDELLMQKISAETDYIIKFCWHRDAVVNTKPNRNISDFLQQRNRWASKGLFYKNRLLIFRLILIYLFYLSIIVQIFGSIFYSKIYFIALTFCLILKFLVEYKIISKGVDFIFKPEILRYFLISEIFQMIYLPLAGIGGILGKFRWKDRKLNR